MLTLEDLGVKKKRGPKGKQHKEVTVAYCLESTEKTNGWAISDSILYDISGCASILKQKLSVVCGPSSVKTFST